MQSIWINKKKESMRTGQCVGRLAAYLILAIAFLFGPAATQAWGAAAPERIFLNWTTDPGSTQTISWIMPDNAPGLVQFLKDDDYQDSFDTARQISITPASCGTQYLYRAQLTDLTPATRYIYRVGREGGWSQALSFTTAADTDNFAFLYMGDVQSGYSEWGNMLNTLYQSSASLKFALLGGDLTDYGNDESEWLQFIDAGTQVFSQIPMMAARGNHDGTMYDSCLALPNNGPTGLKGEFYSFDYGNSHFVVLDSSNNTNENAKQWLQQDLQASSKTWKFVMFHYPAYPAVDDNKGIDDSIRSNWIPILEQNGVDMVFVGHQHEYMRTHPLYQGQVQTDPASYGIVYVMGNSGGKEYAAGGEFPYIAIEQTGSNYQTIDINGDVLTLTARQTSGELIETYSKYKTNKTAPVLTAELTDNPVGQTIKLNFNDDNDWRQAVTGVMVDGNELLSGKYSISAGSIFIDGSVFPASRNYSIAIKASGYQDAGLVISVKSIASDAAVTITISGDGVTQPCTFTWAQLKAMPQVQARCYSTINSWPIKKFYVGEGVKLEDLLEEAEIMPQAQIVKIKASDGFSRTFTRQELNYPRFYYPGLQENHARYGYITGSSDGAERVDIILALKSIEGSNDPTRMNSVDAPLLIMGQRWVTDQTNELFVKKVTSIEVYCDDPGQWEKPAATRLSGKLAPGTTVSLSTSDMDGDSIYYTTDGSDPSVQSIMYNWIKKRWWTTRQDELATINKPLVINRDTVIKAISIGAGKQDSDIATYSYQLDNNSSINSAVTLVKPGSGEEFSSGQKIAIQGMVQGSLNQVNIRVTDPAGQQVYGPTTIQVNGSAFETSFTLSFNAAVGTYTITIEGSGLTTVTASFKVKAAAAGDVALTISGSGVSKEVKYSLAELQTMKQYQQVYSAINTWPSKKWYVGKGVSLRELLAAAGANTSYGLIRFTSIDGYSMTLTLPELFEPRYLYPQFMSGGGESDGHIAGSNSGAQAVDPILALLGAEGTDDYGYMNDVSAILLMMGQRVVTEQTSQLFVKNINKIEVLTGSPPRCDTPQASPVASTVATGTMVRLSTTNMDDDKIYYTTDGSNPTINSTMYNPVASRWWSARGDAVVAAINSPIVITRDTTIKAVSIGPGKMDSEVATFTYKVGTAALDMSKTVNPSQDNTIQIGNEAIIEIPAYALHETNPVEVKIQKLSAPPPVPADLKLASSVYQFTIGSQTSYSFAKKVTIKLGFDTAAISTDETPVIHYYDETAGQWVKLGGTAEGNTITVQVEHFTKYAVMAINKSKPKLEPLKEPEKQEAAGKMVKLTDILEHWARKNIERLVAANAVAGYPDGSFRPDSTISRAEFVTLLVKVFKISNKSGKPFADTADHWAKDYIAAAAASGLVQGYNGKGFNPDQPITREQMAVIICRAAKLKLIEEEPNFFDHSSISSWAKTSMAAVVRFGIMKGYPDHTIQPQTHATRAEAVSVIVNAMSKQ